MRTTPTQFDRVRRHAALCGVVTMMLTLVTMTLAGAPARAVAQLEGARSALAEADFERAERAFTRALDADVLSRTAVVVILEGRAIARWALGEERAATEDLEALRALEPAYALPPEAPPALVEAFAALPREPLAAELSWTEDEVSGAGSLQLRVSVRNDPSGLVRAVRLHTRLPGEDGWLVREQRELELRVSQGDAVEAWVELIGPGGAVLATEGSASAPIVRGAGARRALGDPSRGGDDTGLWVGVGVGVAVILGLAIGVGAAVGSAQSELTQPAAPVLVGF